MTADERPSFPRIPAPPETLVPCPACERCPCCHGGDHMVTIEKRNQWRIEHPKEDRHA